MKNQIFIALFIGLNLTCSFSNPADNALSAYEKIFGRLDSLIRASESSQVSTPAVGWTSQTINPVAVVDLALVHLLHPSMKDFNFIAQSFLRPIPQDLKVDPRFYLEQRQRAYREIRTEHSVQKRNLEMQRRSIHQEILWEKSHLNKRINDRIRDFQNEPEKLGDEIQKLEEEVWSKIFTLEEKLKVAQSEYLEWTKKHASDNFLAEDERDAKFQQIAKEIQDELDTIRREMGVHIVLNSSELPKRRLAPFELPDLISDSNLHLENSLARMLGNRAPLGGKGSVKITPEQAYENLLPHFTQYEWVRNTFSEVVDNILFLGSKPDLTYALLKRIWNRHNITPEIQERIIAAINAKKGER
jgi:hypothetical protein